MTYRVSRPGFSLLKGSWDSVGFRFPLKGIYKGSFKGICKGSRRGLGILKRSWDLVTRVVITVTILIITYSPQSSTSNLTYLVP